MTIRELASEDIAGLVGTRHPIVGFEYPPNGLQPYYQWLISTLHLLAEAGVGGLRVAQDDISDTNVVVSPGKVTLDGLVLNYSGGNIDLAAFNNDTALLWIYNNTGFAAIGTASTLASWPAYPHIKLAEVSLLAGAITQIQDRRHETILSKGLDADVLRTLPQYSITLTTQGDTLSPSVVTIIPQDFIGNPIAATDYLRLRICDSDGYALATNATITAAGNTTVAEEIVTGKESIYKSDVDGTFILNVANAIAETVTLRIGAAPLSHLRGNFTETLDITHI